MAGEVEALAREIGATFAPAHDTLAFRARWASSLAVLVGALGGIHACPYRDRVQEWVDRIDNATDDAMGTVLDAVREEISEIDSDDGWASDPAGSALEHVALCLMPRTRWMAHAGEAVWSHVVGSGVTYNDVVAFSRKAWLRDLYDRCATGRA